MGALSLLPLIGLPASLIAFWFYHSVRRSMANSWNPAATPLVIGFILAWIGLVVSLLAVTFGSLVIWNAIESSPAW